MLRKVFWIIVIVLVVGFGILSAGSRFLTDWMWFDSLGYSQIFVGLLSWEWGVKLIAWLGLSLFIFINILVTKKAVNQALWRYPKLNWLNKSKYILLAALTISLLLGMVYSAGYGNYYWEFAQFFNAESFGVMDPIFNKDLGFYFFKLTVYQLLVSGVLTAVFLALVVTVGIYFLTQSFQVVDRRMQLSAHARNHLSILAGLFFVAKATDYYLSAFGLLYNSSGVVYGAAYTDINIRLIVLRMLVVIALAVGLVFFTQLYRKRKLLIGSLVLWLAVSIIGGGLVPAIVQQWLVEPNEYVRELPYIENHIAMTRAAYDLDKFQESIFPAVDELSKDDIADNQETINNIRLWDPRLILQTYRQLQEMRPYYSFGDADVGRYYVDGEYREVLISARELDINLTQNRNWINDHLQYTHGYGVVVSPVNEISNGQLPNFWLSDIPPHGLLELRLSEPRIYFGEQTSQYVLVNTLTEEFDYPAADGNAYTTYDGNDGVELSTLLHRFAFAFRYSSTRFLLSNYITTDSKVLFDRDIHTRVRKIAPFLQYDNDPYIVISESGRLYWIIDAYTVSNRFPYAQPTYDGRNYIRNSVKVIVDAYHGTVGFYQVSEDPLLETYSAIFPGWIKSIDELPENLGEHIRYPEDLLAIQANMYGTYHMTDTRVFYNREDVWTIAREVYAGVEQNVVPYYLVMELPNEQEQDVEMVLMLPFTPIRRNNMIAWLAARNDGEHYGEIMVYRFPKDSLTYGPAQIEATIDQNSSISQALSLWGQRGSQVIRGNLLVLPIANGILYIEPLFLQSEQSAIPQLQRVIVAHNDDVVMEPTLEEALLALFGARNMSEEAPSSVVKLPEYQVIDENLTLEAYTLYQKAQNALRNEDFVTFGEAWNELEFVLKGIMAE